MPIAVDVDLVRFEKNLLQIGFFGANDARDKNRTTRRVEQTVIRNGSKIKVAAEFRGSEALGLPSTTDRDKFIALLKIISEERLKTGVINNPVRFSGYRLIQELGLSRNGEIYEEILRWGKRMTDTTITSEHVVYRAAKKVYSDETLHVFRAFRRTGSSNLNGTERQEHYEVVLEDWLLENLNQRYVIPEDFNAYKQLTRPTAKGIFGNLHLWFHASSGRPVEKDYGDLCNLLNVQAYPHLSKIKSTMGLALNELVAIKYISKWDVQKMSSKLGYKVVLVAGDELLRVLDSTRPERRDQSPAPRSLAEPENPMRPFSSEEQEAAALLKQYGVLATKATNLVAMLGAHVVVDTVEYLASNALGSKRKNVENPAGLIIYSLEQGLPIPASFISSRKKKVSDLARKEMDQTEVRRLQEEIAYGEWIESEQERLLGEQFAQIELDRKLLQMIASLTQSDDRFRRMPSKARTDVARRMLRKELAAEMPLLSFEDWRKASPPASLF
ncbi:MAG: replication initiator protein A [Janthinobacterium lividum]